MMGVSVKATMPRLTRVATLAERGPPAGGMHAGGCPLRRPR